MNKKIFIKVYSKRQLMIISLVVLLIVVGIVNSRIEFGNKKKINPSVIEVSNPTVHEDESNTEEDTIDEMKLKREIERSKEINLLKSLLNSQADANAQEKIDNKIAEIIDISNKEMICENVLSSKGLGECAVFYTGDTIYVVVQKKLEKKELIQIQNVIMNVFRVDFSKIRVSQSKSSN
ncbi:SpoIIIAH-like family protein [Anaerocellum danielii]|uniref:SpoIIIAH-like family protein n=1 Tax=Anaerocellum danielii TaxID=1387557 RepID=A0ABZ0U4T9_9FIRM|nr:SpoIIIAH-like family protein [Caldicellulosiruptor danielii]WPX09723.1 SpoIIIAH-like family protein [Caldicellulosiruptor danielii]